MVAIPAVPCTVQPEAMLVDGIILSEVYNLPTGSQNSCDAEAHSNEGKNNGAGETSLPEDVAGGVHPPLKIIIIQGNNKQKGQFFLHEKGVFIEVVGLNKLVARRSYCWNGYKRKKEDYI